MSKTQYEIVWKKGGWFEDGHFALIPKKSFGEKAGEALIGYILILALLLLVLSLVVLTAPLWIVIIGFQMIREKRYYAGIMSIFALVYFYLDIKKQWITSFLFFGYTNDKGEMINGFLSPSYLEYFEAINLIAVGLGLAYIIDLILVSKFGKKFNDDRITTPQLIIYLAPMILGFLISNSSRIDNNIATNPTVVEEAVEVPKDNSLIVTNSSTLKSENYSNIDSVGDAHNTDSYSNEKIKYIFSANGGTIIYFDNGKYVNIPEYSKENIRIALNKTPDGSYRINKKGELIQDDRDYGIIPENEYGSGLLDWVVINYKWIEKPQ